MISHATVTRPAPRFALTAEELEAFHTNGIAGPFDAYEPGEMEAQLKRLRPKLLDNTKAIYRAQDAISGVTNLANYDRHFDIPFLAEHIARPQIVDRVASVLGPDVLCWRSEFFPKYPGDEGTDWHQAGTFASIAKKPQLLWPEGSNGRGTLTVWTAFTESNLDNGCMQVIPGTHRTIYYDESRKLEYDAARINQVQKNGTFRGFFGYDYRQLQVDPDWRPDESKAVSLILRPGQFMMFFSTLLHGSHPHSGKTKQMRLGYAARYVPSCVRIYPESTTLDEFGGKASLEKWGAVQVSGTDAYRHNRIAATDVHGNPFRCLWPVQHGG